MRMPKKHDKKLINLHRGEEEPRITCNGKINEKHYLKMNRQIEKKTSPKYFKKYLENLKTGANVK